MAITRLPRFQVRIPPETKRHIADLAERRRMTVSALLRRLVAAGLAADPEQETDSE